MTDDKKPTNDLGDIDWDEALSEWEQTSFDPEVAKDRATAKPGALAGASRPLYRPPTVSPAVRPRAPVPSVAKLWAPDEDDDGMEETRIAQVPDDLLMDDDSESTESTHSAQSPTVHPPPPPPPARPLLPTLAGDEEADSAPNDLHQPFDLTTPESHGSQRSLGPALLVPKLRHFDPNEVTVVGGEADLANRRSAILAELSGLTDQAGSNDPGPDAALAAEHELFGKHTRAWVDERPASEWLSATTRAGLEVRGNWLEQEAQALVDQVARARGLLACSEIFATAGDRERAQALAAEARDLAPSLALAHRQARALMPFSLSACEDYIEALDAEARVSPEGAAQIHSTLLAAETLRAAGQHESATHRLENAARIGPEDARPAVLRAALALSADAVDDAALRLRGSLELAPVAEAVAACVRLRGIRAADGALDTSAREHPDVLERVSRGQSPTEVLHRVRQALDKGDLAEAAPLVAELASLPELADAARWLAASLGATTAIRRPEAAQWLRELAEGGDQEARRALLARALELQDPERLTEALGSNGPLTSAERLTIAALGGLPLSATDHHLDSAASTPGMEALAAAITSIAMPSGDDREAEVRARTTRTSGSRSARALIRLGRLLAASAPVTDIEAALADVGVGRAVTLGGANLLGSEPPRAPGEVRAGEAHRAELRAVGLEIAMRDGRTSVVGGALEAWGGGWGSREDGAIGALAAALVAERAGDRARALECFKAARIADPGSEAALRAIASLEPIDLVAEMNGLADDLGDGPRGAVARLEAVARGEGILPEPTRAHLLEQAHRAAPTLPIASFLAERIARRAGDIDEVLRWVRERRATANDPVEAALDAVREALLIADRDPLLASERLQEAHRARPNDVALRDLYERMGAESPQACASWREQRAGMATGNARTLLLLEAAREYESAGDEESALRCAEAAGADDAPLGRIARERAELRARRVARLAEELLSTAKGTSGPRSRREAYERLASLDETARQDPASALLWHRAILDDYPTHEPSLRHVEHYLIGEGRNDELEPIASAIARVLRATGSGECTAHAELAVRLQLRQPEAKWSETYDMVELAAGEAEPSLWSLRMLQAHSRARADDGSFLSATQRLLDRTSRPAEVATLLVLSGQAAARLGRLDEARSFFRRASHEDPGDAVAWALMADVCRRAGDARGAAEASEAVARCAPDRGHQLQAWGEAAHIWEELGDDADQERAIIAFEAAAAIDITYQDVFDRLSLLYASRKKHGELASLLERRVSVVDDAEQRSAMQVRRGRVLLDAGDLPRARQAFESALHERPEDPVALSALADLCLSLEDWEAADRALVHLARLLGSPDEQRAVYTRLGDLYTHHLLNLSRAELALKEVLKRAPDDVETTEKLVEVYKRQNDAARATELQQELIDRARSQEEKRKRFLELATIHEYTAHDNRRTEQTLEAARREFPQDVRVLRALAEFYVRHHQAPAFNILLDRAGGDARRALAAGRVSPALFDILAAVFELRDKKGAASVTRAMLASLDGQPAKIAGGGHRAFEAALDEWLAPEGLPTSLRTLLARTGDALDHVTQVDLRALKASALPAEAPLAQFASGIGFAIGLGAIQLLVSPKLGSVCIPVGSSPPVLVVGESLVGDERLGPFLVVRAIKLVQAKASVLARATPADLAVLVSAWLKCFNPTWQPQGVNLALVNAVGGRLQAALARNLDRDLAPLALEAAAAIGTQAGALGALAAAWADRVALLFLGDPNVALDAIAAAGGGGETPLEPKERAAWIARTPEARDLIAFAVTDAFAEARTRIGADG